MAETRRRAAKEIIPAHWADAVEGEFTTSLKIDVSRTKGVIAELAAAISDAEAGVEDIRIAERNAALSTVGVRLSVRDRVHLARVMRRLRGINNVHHLSRASL